MFFFFFLKGQKFLFSEAEINKSLKRDITNEFSNPQRENYWYLRGSVFNEKMQLNNGVTWNYVYNPFNICSSTTLQQSNTSAVNVFSTDFMSEWRAKLLADDFKKTRFPRIFLDFSDSFCKFIMLSWKIEKKIISDDFVLKKL